MFVAPPSRPSPAPALTGFLPSLTKPFLLHALRTLALDNANEHQATPAESAVCALLPRAERGACPISVSPLVFALRVLQTQCGKKPSRGLLNGRLPFPHFFLTLRKISPIIATLTKNARGTGVCTYRPLSGKAAVRTPQRRFPFWFTQRDAWPCPADRRAKALGYARSVLWKSPVGWPPSCRSLVTAVDSSPPFPLHCSFPLHWGTSPE
jgi:hypothetical protein